ncbi:MAG: hypothetical protein ABSE07_02335 [Methanoregula sp.]|jgi:hypothetical protein
MIPDTIEYRESLALADEGAAMTRMQYICHSCGYVDTFARAQCYKCNSDHFFEVPVNVYSQDGVNPKKHHKNLRAKFSQHCHTFNDNPDQKFIVSPEDAAYFWRYDPGLWRRLVRRKLLFHWQIFIIGRDGVSV